MARLDYTHLDPQIILDAGCGLGNFSHHLAHRYPKAQVISIDFAEQMIRTGKEEFYSLNGLLGDIEKLPFQAESMDMIFANQSVHDTDSALLFKEFHRVLKPGGVLFFSSLGPDSLKELKMAWECVDTYGHVNEKKDMHDLGDELLRAQFAQPVVDSEYITVHYKDPRRLLNDLKEQGSYNNHRLRRTGLMGKDAMEYLLRGLEEQRNEEGKIPMTYEVIYGHAWRGENKPFYNAETGETFISVDMLRR